MGEVGDLPSVTYDILRKEGVADGYARIDNSVGIEVPKPLIEDHRRHLHRCRDSTSTRQMMKVKDKQTRLYTKLW